MNDQASTKLESKFVLAIETSCDDTSVAVLRCPISPESQINESGGDSQPIEVMSCVSQAQDLHHAPHGGIVPEIASRNHLANLHPLIQVALSKAGLELSEIDAFAATNRPGLIGSLIVGVVTAKTLAQMLSKPWIAVNHLEGHIWAPFLRDSEYQPEFGFEKFIALAVSGGHTSFYLVSGFGQYKVLGATRDDAAGEALDKFAKAIGLGFPGGAQVDRLSQGGNTEAYDFPKASLDENSCEMSFSGLKSSAMRLLDSLSSEEISKHKADLCASFQESVVSLLTDKMQTAISITGCRNLVLTGGVSANTRLRQQMQELAVSQKCRLMLPPLRYCTDNAAMVGYVGMKRFLLQEFAELSTGPQATSYENDFDYSFYQKFTRKRAASK